MTDKNIQRTISVLRVVAKLPLWFLYLISDLGYFVVCYLVRYRNKVIKKNLKASFPDKTDKALRRIQKDFYRQLCDTAVESFKLLNMKNQVLRKRVDVQGCELVERVAAEGRSVILLLGHCGCWEWAQEISVRYKAPKRGGEIYKHIPNRLVEELMNALRAHWDTTLIEMRQAVRTVLRWHKEGEPFLVGFISDQRAYTAAKRWTVFMNQITDFVSGGEELAAKIGAEVLYLDIEKPKRGYYRLTFKQVHPEQTDVDAPYTRQFYKMLEETIRRRPSLWLWSHNRWRNNHECPEEIKNRLMKSKI